MMKKERKEKLNFALVHFIYASASVLTAMLDGWILVIVGLKSWTFFYLLFYIILIAPIYYGSLAFVSLLFGMHKLIYPKQKKVLLKLVDFFRHYFL